MPCNRKPVAPTIDVEALASRLVGQLANGTLSIETPQLGRVEYLRPTEVYAALNILRQEAARASGVQMAGVFTIGYDRGLGCPKEFPE
jgi:hypothetical protein